MNPSTKLMLEVLQRLAGEGKCYAEAAAHAGVSYHYVASFSRRFGVKFRKNKRGPKPSIANERSFDMRLMYESGKTLHEIGQQYGITRERVRQILTRDFGIRAKDGGKAEQGRVRRRNKAKSRDERSQKAWGCSFRQYRKILKHPGKPTYAYASQRRNARERGIAWELSLYQWWKVWEHSGHWDERGRGRGYQMCRLNDVGPYAVDNVYIATGADNMRDYWANIRAQETREAA